MRSNDAVKGSRTGYVLLHRCFKEIAARALALDLGSLQHCVGSFHLYDTDIDNATAFLAEGFQLYQEYDASYALGRSRPSIKQLLQIESMIRLTDKVEVRDWRFSTPTRPISCDS